jgi:hypothetical protein
MNINYEELHQVYNVDQLPKFEQIFKNNKKLMEDFYDIERKEQATCKSSCFIQGQRQSDVEFYIRKNSKGVLSGFSVIVPDVDFLEQNSSSLERQLSGSLYGSSNRSALMEDIRESTANLGNINILLRYMMLFCY